MAEGGTTSAPAPRPRSGEGPGPAGGGLGQATAGALFAGVGLGGFLDGILLHQILQWHHMLSTVEPPETMELLRLNMLWDGVFHAAVWVATLAGVFLLWRGARRGRGLPGVTWLVGWMLVGWGAFNFVEGLVDHHLLGIHHVRGYGPNAVWDYGFLLSGPVLILAGWLTARGDAAERGPRRRPR